MQKSFRSEAGLLIQSLLQRYSPELEMYHLTLDEYRRIYKIDESEDVFEHMDDTAREVLNLEVVLENDGYITHARVFGRYMYRAEGKRLEFWVTPVFKNIVREMGSIENALQFMKVDI